jgi:hypothetical protein
MPPASTPGRLSCSAHVFPGRSVLCPPWSVRPWQPRAAFFLALYAACRLIWLSLEHLMLAAALDWAPAPRGEGRHPPKPRSTHVCLFDSKGHSAAVPYVPHPLSHMSCPPHAHCSGHTSGPHPLICSSSSKARGGRDSSNSAAAPLLNRLPGLNCVCMCDIHAAPAPVIVLCLLLHHKTPATAAAAAAAAAAVMGTHSNAACCQVVMCLWDCSKCVHVHACLLPCLLSIRCRPACRCVLFLPTQYWCVHTYMLASMQGLFATSSRIC